MATRKKTQRGRKPRSQVRQSARGPESDLLGESEDEETEEYPRSSSPRPSTVTGEMVALMREFLGAQQQREERYLSEIRGIRESMQQTGQAAATPSSAASPRMGLPTPGRSRPPLPPPPPSPPPPPPPLRSEPQMPVFQAGEDMENFLRRFERLARTWRWPEEEWSCRLVPLLTGKALEAYLAMDEEQADVYDELREALLEKFNISPETYRQRFRASTVPAGESATETYHRLRNLYRRWVRPEQSTKEEIGELIILEQLLRVLPYDSRMWVKEHEPTSGLAAARLAQQYGNAHRGNQRSQPPRDLLCQKPGRTDVVQHTIHLKDPTPSRQRPYRIPERLLTPLKTEIETMIQLGVIEPSVSEWSSPIVIVPKKDHTLRVCIDFRKLNSQSKFDAYPMPRVDELLERIGRAQFITTLDLCKGYWQVPLDPASRPYTAFKTPLGLFHFTVLPFGLHGAPATFQRMMDRVLQGGEECSAAYLDDVVIFSNTWTDHIRHLKQTLERIQSAGLTLNVGKCRWAQREACYLGYLLGNGQLKPQVSKVEAIHRSPPPRTKKEVRSFLGLVGWYRRFIPEFASVATPLTNLLAKAVRNPLPWTEDCELAFRSLKERICSSSVLQIPDFSQRFVVQVDASATGLGAVLAQGIVGEEKPVVFLSRKLLSRESRYSTIEKECLAIKWALDSLRYYLLGREFDLETDHRALSWINAMKDNNARITRWYLALQPFRYNVRHIPGRKNVIADYLSRYPSSTQLGEGKSSVKKET
ncbi:gag-pol fusion protein [Pimephales promelas]|nr:gag-pol fusion protein [Pimephales promelas]